MVLEPCQPDRVFLLVWLALALAFLQAAQPGLVEAPQPGQAAQPVVEAGQAGLLLALVEGLLLALVEVQPEYGWVLGLQEAGQPGLVGPPAALLAPPGVGGSCQAQENWPACWSCHMAVAGAPITSGGPIGGCIAAGCWSGQCTACICCSSASCCCWCCCLCWFSRASFILSTKASMKFSQSLPAE